LVRFIPSIIFLSLSSPLLKKQFQQVSLFYFHTSIQSTSTIFTLSLPVHFPLPVPLIPTPKDRNFWMSQLCFLAWKSKTIKCFLSTVTFYNRLRSFSILPLSHSKYSIWVSSDFPNICEYSLLNYFNNPTKCTLAELVAQRVGTVLYFSGFQISMCIKPSVKIHSAGPQPQSCWFSKSWVGLENLYFK
jgi:hypothetical protein